MIGTMITLMLRIRKTTATMSGVAANRSGASRPTVRVTAKQPAAAKMNGVLLIRGAGSRFMGRVARTLLFVGCGPFLKAKRRAPPSEKSLERGGRAHMLRSPPMNFSHFVRIDRERRGVERHYVVHTGNPQFTLEL